MFLELNFSSPPGGDSVIESPPWSASSWTAAPAPDSIVYGGVWQDESRRRCFHPDGTLPDHLQIENF